MRFVSFLILLAATLLPLAGQQVNDVLVNDKTLVQRCVIKGSGSRMIAVGSPDGFNFAFDAQRCFAEFCWFGGFLDFSGEINGRGGKGCKILGIRRSLGSNEAPMRMGTPEEAPESLRFRGYRRDASGVPTFLFEVDGVPVEQMVSSSGTNRVSMKFKFGKSGKVPRFFLIDPERHDRIELGESLEWSGKGVIRIPGNLAEASWTIHLKPSDETFVRKIEELSGEEIFGTYCSACHSLDGSKLIGPSFKNFWGSERVVIREGKEQKIRVDRDYVIESITKPQAAVAKGYEAVPMADFSAVLNKSDIERLADYLSGL